jgi:hypothetical protein
MIHSRRNRQSFLPMLALHTTELLTELGFQQALEDVMSGRCRTIFSSKPLSSSTERASSVALDFDMISLLGRASWRWLSRLVRLLSSERAGLMPFDLDLMICGGFELTCVFIAFFSQLLRHSLTAARTTMFVR